MALPLSVSGLDRLKFSQESRQGGQLRVEFRLGACGQQILQSLLLFGRCPVVKIDEMLILDVCSSINEKAPSNDTASEVVRLRGAFDFVAPPPVHGTGGELLAYVYLKCFRKRNAGYQLS